MPAETLSLNGKQEKAVRKGRMAAKRMIIRSMGHGGSWGQPSAAANNGILKGGVRGRWKRRGRQRRRLAGKDLKTNMTMATHTNRHTHTHMPVHT